MAKQAEIDYLKRLTPEEIRHAVEKPFSDAGCAAELMEIAAIMALLPPPPARLLDLGCGAGWTSIFFARRGYEVVGVDISEDMILHANANKRRVGTYKCNSSSPTTNSWISLPNLIVPCFTARSITHWTRKKLYAGSGTV